MPTPCTEKDAALAFARSWNRLDCTEFIPLLADDAHYASMYVFSELESKAAIEEYLTGKLETDRKSGSQVRAELGRTLLPTERDCVLLYQDGEHIAVFLFQLEGEKIRRYDLCAPELYEVEKTGNFPV